MRGIDKAFVYSKLSSIREEFNIDTSRYIREVAMSDEIPYDIIIFINRYYGISQLATYNNIYDNRRRNPLYKNLVNENLPDEEKAIALSSLLTRSFIRSKMIDESDRQEYLEIMNVRLICDALCDYSYSGDSIKLNEVFMMVRDMLKRLYRNNI